MILLILGLAIVSMFLVGCVDQAAENTEDAEQPDSVEVMDGDGDLVGEAFRFAPYKYRLAKKAVPKLPEMPGYNCLIGFDYVAGPVADDYFYVEDGDAISCVMQIMFVKVVKNQVQQITLAVQGMLLKMAVFTKVRMSMVIAVRKHNFSFFFLSYFFHKNF